MGRCHFCQVFEGLNMEVVSVKVKGILTQLHFIPPGTISPPPPILVHATSFACKNRYTNPKKYGSEIMALVKGDSRDRPRLIHKSSSVGGVKDLHPEMFKSVNAGIGLRYVETASAHKPWKRKLTTIPENFAY